jgi:CheY-like chemotaxis protein
LEGAAFAYYAAGVNRDQARSLAENLRDILVQTDVFIIPVEVSLGVAHLDEFAAADESGPKLASMFSRIAGLRATLARKWGKDQVCSESTLDEHEQASGRILVVDTDEVNVDVLKTALEAMDFEVQTCSDGQQALDTISVTPPDLIIAELMVPKIDGLAVRQQLLDRPHGASIPYLLLSHQKTEDLVQRALSLNIEHVIKKPYLLSEVVGIVRHKLTVNSG